MNRIRTAAIAVGSAVAITVSIAPAALAAPDAAKAALPTVTATIVKGKTLTLAGATKLTPGRVRFVLTTKGSDGNGGTFGLLRFHAGYSFAGYRADEKIYNANSAGKNGPNKKAIAALDHFYSHTDLYGGISLDDKKVGQETIVLSAGTYVAYNDSGPLAANPVTFTVAGATRHSTVASSATVIAEDEMRFAGATKLPASGTLTFANHSESDAHNLILLHVKEGTTAKQVLDFFHSGGNSEPTFGLPGDVGTDLLGAGKSQTLTYTLPKGEYVEICFAPDAETGIPHVFSGMLRIVHLS